MIQQMFLHSQLVLVWGPLVEYSFLENLPHSVGQRPGANQAPQMKKQVKLMNPVLLAHDRRLSTNLGFRPARQARPAMVRWFATSRVGRRRGVRLAQARKGTRR